MRIDVLDFRLLQTNNVGASDGDCVPDNVTFVLETKAVNVPGHDREDKAFFIHGEWLQHPIGYKETKQRGKQKWWWSHNGSHLHSRCQSGWRKYPAR